jgi:HK97 family phage major capsid protein
MTAETVDQLAALLTTPEACTARMREIRTETERLANFTELTRSQEIRQGQLLDEFAAVDRRKRDMTRDADLAKVRAASGGGGMVESGTPFGTDGRSTPLLRHADPWAGDVSTRSQPAGELRGRALSAVERCNTMPDGARERTSKALEVDPDEQGRLARYVIEASQPDYLRAFTTWMRDPQHGHQEWSPAEREAFARVRTLTRAMALGTGSAGGFLVPFQLDPQILISNAGSVNPMREVSRVELTAVNEARFVTSAGVTASWDPEATEVSDDSPVLGQPAIFGFKGAAFVPVSLELYEDSTIAQQVANLFVDAKAQLEATAFTLGTGSGQPKGVITAVSAVGGSVVGDTGTAFATAQPYAVQNALPARWRPRARFMANLSVINAYRQLPIGTGLQTSLVDDSSTPPRMAGWELWENSTMDGTITTTANDFLLLAGDFSQYIVTDRIGTMIEVIPHLFGAAGRPTGQRGFYMHWRTGGDVVIPDAFRLLNLSA